MTAEQPKTFSLTLTQVAAATLAAVTAAVLGSRLGVAGTVLGAALASAVTTVASAVYQHSLERSRARIRSASSRPEDSREGAPVGRRFAVAAGALAAFGIALLVLTGLEAVRGAPLSGGDGTTVGRVLDRSDGATRPGPPSGTTVPAGVTPTTEPTTGPSTGPSTGPTTGPSTEPSAGPTSGPSAEPSTGPSRTTAPPTSATTPSRPTTTVSDNG